MAYDWVYPPRKGGEALIHVDWGNDYTLKKPYWVFRQWAAPLSPGMKVVQATAAGPGAAGPGAAARDAGAAGGGAAAGGVKPTAFLSADGRSLVVHVVNTGDAPANVVLAVTGGPARAVPAARHRTSATEDMGELPPLAPGPQGYADTLPARSLTSYRLALK
jgi:hypothetical protein